MVTLNLAYTAPINPPGTTPILTQAQVWRALERKVDHAQEFVKAITVCEVLEKDGATTMRRVKFASNESKWVVERCVLYKPSKVDFFQTNGSVITNTISLGPSLQPEDLWMTYAFQWLLPEIEEGSKEAEQRLKQNQEMAKMAVDKSIEACRRLLQEGKLD